MDIGIFLTLEPAGRDASRTYLEALEVTVAAESLGYHSAWVASRHFSPDYASSGSPIVLLSAAAAVTRTIVLGTSVVSLPLENPIRLAEDFATLDAVCNGRARLGVGSGDDPPAFQALGVDFEDRKSLASTTLVRLLDVLAGEDLKGLTIHPPVTDARSKVALAAQSSGGAEWAGRLEIGLLQGRSEPGVKDLSVTQSEASAAYRRVHSLGRVTTARNAWIGDPDDPQLSDSMQRYNRYLVERGRDPLPSDRLKAIEKLNIVFGSESDIADELRATVATVDPDELLITVDPGGMPAADTIKRLETVAASFGLKGD